MAKRFRLLLQSDYEVDPNSIRMVLTVHPNDYNEVSAMLREGFVLKGSPSSVDAAEWATVESLPPASVETSEG